MSAYSARQIARKNGYRSGLEDTVANYLKEHKVKFLFTNSNRKLRKGAKSSYAEWCIRYGFRFYNRIIPEDWLKEKGKNNHPKFIKFMGTKLRR
jgi:hypothetical protein